MISDKGRRGALLLATLFAVTFAVLAVHALTSHERAHSAPIATGLPLAVDTGEADHAHADLVAAPQSNESETPGHDGGGAGELCLALLSLMTALIALTLRRGVPRRLLHVAPRWNGPRSVGLGRSLDPPCLHRLSILRC